MDIKVGFIENGREIAIKSNEDKDALKARFDEAIASNAATITVEDEQGRTYILRQSAIAFVEFGTSNKRAVGFAN